MHDLLTLSKIEHSSQYLWFLYDYMNFFAISEPVNISLNIIHVVVYHLLKRQNYDLVDE